MLRVGLVEVRSDDPKKGKPEISSYQDVKSQAEGGYGVTAARTQCREYRGRWALSLERCHSDTG